MIAKQSIFRPGIALSVFLAAIMTVWCVGTAKGQAPVVYTPAPPVTAPVPNYAPLNTQQLQQLVSTIALYPDPLLAQIFPASTYPLDVVAASQWLARNPNPQQAAIDAQPWDPSIKALVHYPTILQKLSGDVNWLEELGAAFLNQQGDVMNAVQEVRAQAQAANVLASTPQQQVTEDNGDIDINPVDPQTIYVPAYDPVYVNGGWSFADGLVFGVGYPCGVWLDNDCYWSGGWIVAGVAWDSGWRAGWRGPNGEHGGDYHGGGYGRGESPGQWRHDPNRPGPIHPPNGIRPQFNNESRGYSSEPGREGGSARSTNESFGTMERSTDAQRAADRGRASRGYTEQPAAERPAARAPQQEPRQEQPSSAFHGSSSGGASRAQSSRGSASRGRSSGGGGAAHGRR